MPEHMKPFDIKRPCYAMASKNGTDAEITLYGDVVERRPVDWWTGKEIEGSFIIQDEFLEDLKAVAGCKRVTIRLNSYGGDAVVGMLIHNRLRDMARGGTALTCVVDAVAMSAASVIMSACDKVQVNATGLVMIHKAAAFQFGWYNADDLGEEKTALDQYDSAIAAAYARKTGMAQEELLTMMGETTYLTGKDAVELGFADELLEDAEPLQLAASADGTRIFAGGRAIRLAPGMFAPDFIPTAPEAPTENTAEPAGTPAVDANTQPGDPGNLIKEVQSMNLEQLREQYPDLVQNIADEATQAERARIQAIDEIAGIYADELVQAAKYGDEPCTAETLAYRAAKAQAQQGGAFLNAIDEDAKAGKVNEVPAANAPATPVDPDSPEALAAAGKQAAQDYLQARQ